MKVKTRVFVFVLLVMLYSHIPAQTPPAPTSTVVPNFFDTSSFPQWVQDLRRWEIVAFGSYPFSMFLATFAMDTSRWIENGMDWSDPGRRYAPWPLKSAGAVEMSNKQYEMTMAIAAGISAAVAVADLIIVQVKRHKARQYAESLPEGTTIIVRKPWPLTEDTGAAQDIPVQDTPASVTPDSAEP